MTGAADSFATLTFIYDNALRLGTITQSAGGTGTAELLDTCDPGGRLIEQTPPMVAHTYITTSKEPDNIELLSFESPRLGGNWQ